MLTPVITGRESSVAAANSTRSIVRRSVAASSSIEGPSSIAAMRGKSSASIVLMVDSVRAHSSFAWRVRSGTSIDTVAGGSCPTKSVISRAGIVVAPSSSIFAPIQVLMEMSRSVAERRNRPPSVAIRTFEVMGSVDRAATARPTIASPRWRFSCRT